MNNIKSLINEDIVQPYAWYVSTPSLYGGTYLWDIVGNRKAALVGNPDGIEWKQYSQKPSTFGGCLTTVNASDYAYLDISLTFTKPYTICFWIKFTSIVHSGYVLDNASVTNSLKIYGASKLLIGSAIGATVLPLNRWLHISVVSPTVSGEAYIAYINGKEDLRQTLTSNLSTSIFQAVCSRKASPSSTVQTKADFDDILVYNTVLSPEAIKGVYTNSLNKKMSMRQFIKNISSNPNDYNNYLMSLMGGQF